jgi:DNA-binding LacI/PurR family transcriptional regulator
VAAETRARVLEAVSLLGYRPNSAARHALTGSTSQQALDGSVN